MMPSDRMVRFVALWPRPLTVVKVTRCLVRWLAIIRMRVVPDLMMPVAVGSAFGLSSMTNLRLVHVPVYMLRTLLLSTESVPLATPVSIAVRTLCVTGVSTGANLSANLLVWVVLKFVVRVKPRKTLGTR